MREHWRAGHCAVLHYTVANAVTVLTGHETCDVQTKRCPQTGCKQQSITGFPWNRARRTERLLSLWLFRAFHEQFQNGMNSRPDWPRMGSLVTPHRLRMEE